MNPKKAYHPRDNSENMDPLECSGALGFRSHLWILSAPSASWKRALNPARRQRLGVKSRFKSRLCETSAQLPFGVTSLSLCPRSCISVGITALALRLGAQSPGGEGTPKKWCPLLLPLRPPWCKETQGENWAQLFLCGSGAL